MARPIVHPTTEEAYAGLGPWAAADEGLDYPLLRFVDILTKGLAEIDDLVRDSADGRPGWSELLDVERTRRDRLPYLAQFVGVTIPKGLTEANERVAVKGAVGFRRGTKAAIAGAAQPYLTGNRTVQIVERVHADPAKAPYHFTVRTFAKETPVSSRVLTALMQAKPAGLILTYEVFTGQTYDELKATEMTYDELGETYATYYDMSTSVPVV